MNNHLTCMFCSALSEMRLSSAFVDNSTGETLVYAACHSCGAVHLGSCIDDEVVTIKEAPQTPEVMVHAYQAFASAGAAPSSGKKNNHEAIDITTYKNLPEIELSESALCDTSAKLSIWARLLAFFRRK